jgi:hypothetical protein
MTTKTAMAVALAAGLMAGAQQTATAQAITSSDGELQAKATMVDVKQVKDDLFAGTEKFAAGASDVTEVNLDPTMMGMVRSKGDSELAHKMKFMVIHTYEYPKEGMYKQEDVDAYRKKLQDGTWSCSIHVKDKSGTTDICSRSSPDHEGSEMVILTAEPKELTFIHMSGNMSMEELSRMGGGMGGGRRPLPPVPPTPPTAPVAPVAPAPQAPR